MLYLIPNAFYTLILQDPSCAHLKNSDKKARCWFIDVQRWILGGKQIFPDVEIRTDVLTFYGNGEIQGVIGDEEEAKRIRIQEYERKMDVYKKENNDECYSREEEEEKQKVHKKDMLM